MVVEPTRTWRQNPHPGANLTLPELAMKIDKTQFDDYAILTLKGEFDTFYCPSLMAEVDELIDRGVNHLILNMRLVKFINSTA